MHRLFVASLLLLPLACEEAKPCRYVQRCVSGEDASSADYLERCEVGFGPVFVEQCIGPNVCLPIGDDFAACILPSADGGLILCDGDYSCVAGQRRICESSDLRPELSWVRASPCGGGKACFVDGGQADCR